MLSFFWRFLLAAVLALLVVPVANNITPDPFAFTDADYPPALVEAADRHLGELATTYGIPKPKLRFVSAKAAGITSKSDIEPGSPLEIRLGKPLQRPAYLEKPELLMAVVSHEFGHAVMAARNDEFPAHLILGMYGLGLFALLIVFPKKRGMLAVAVAITGTLSIMLLLPRWPTVHDAYLAFIIGLPVIAGVIWFGDLKRHLPPGLLTRITSALPSARSFAIAALIAAPAFFITLWLVGKMNVERELRADIVGACAVSPAAMRAALSNLSDRQPSAWSEALDAFHPPMRLRQDVLTTLDDPVLKASACKAVLEGKEALIIQGSRIQ